MWPDRVSIPGPLTYESGALPTVLRGPAPFDINLGQLVDSKQVCHKIPLQKLFTCFLSP